MPPRKSTASNPPEDGAEPGPATTKASKERDGLGVEVQAHAVPEIISFCTNNDAGSHITKIDDRPSRKRSTTSKHTNTKRRTTGHAQECDSLRELHRIPVRSSSSCSALHVRRCFRECAPCSESIHLITFLLTQNAYSSNDLARMSNKKTISPQDVMSALKDAELEGFLPRLEAELKSELDLSSIFFLHVSAALTYRRIQRHPMRQA
jgi:hypothetical protein